MKINSNKYPRSLIKLYLLKNQIYTSSINSINKICLDAFTLELKQSLKIIYLYHTKKKKILFIGFPFNKILHNKTSHLFVSKLTYEKTRLDSKKFDLIVFNKTSFKDNYILTNLNKETNTLVVFGSENKYSKKYYNVFGLLKKQKTRIFCFFIIFSILTRSIKNI